MAKGYWIGRIDVHDAEAYKDYVTTATPAYQEFGAKFLVRSGEVGATEGQARSRNVVIEFPTYEAALACYESATYQKAKAIRQSVSEGDITVVKGHE